MKKETKKLIAAGIAMALSCGAWGSVSAADSASNVANPGEDKNVNSTYSDGKIDAGYYGLKATGDASSSTEGKISLTTPKVEIHATGIGIQGRNWGSVIVGNTDTQEVSISGASQGVKLSIGGYAKITGEQVKIANDIKKKLLIEVDNTVPNANRPAQLIVKGKQIELVSAGKVIDVKSASPTKKKSYHKASVVLGDDSTESLTMTGTDGVYAGNNSEIIGKAKDINLVVNSTARTQGVQATGDDAKVQLTAKDHLLVDVTGNGAKSVHTTGDTEVNLSGNDVKIHATANDDMVYGIQSETHSKVKISGNTVEIGTTGGKNGDGEIGSAALYADQSNIEVDSNKVVVNTTKATEHAFAVYSNRGSAITLGKDANSEVQISSSSKGKAWGVAVASEEGAKAPTVGGVNGGTSSTPTTQAPDGSKVTINGAKINVSAEGKTARGLYAQDNNKISVGNAGSDIQISAKGEDAVGVLALEHGSVDLNGKNAVIKAESSGNQASEGIHVQNNDMTDTDHRATVNVNTENMTIHADSALVAMSNSVLNVNSNLVTNGKNAILTRGNSDLNINTDGKHTIQLNGDIVFNVTNDGNSGKKADSNVNINLNNAESYLSGSVKKTQSGSTEDVNMDVYGMKMNIANGASWNMTSDSFANDVTVSDGGKINVQEGAKNFTADSIAMNNGNINLQGSGQKAEVKELKGKGGIITTNSLDNTLNIGTKAEHATLKVEGSGEIGDKILAGKATLEDLAATAKVGDKTASDEVETQDGIIAGKMFAKVTDGKIDASTIKRAIQQHNQAVSSMTNLSLMTWRQENNDMNKRLGEVRASEGSQGIWARMARGQSKYGAQGIKNQYNYYQLGYDSKISDDWILGGAFTYTDGDSSYINGSGTNKHTGFTVYGSNLRDDGSFIDLIAKYAHMKNDFDVNGGVGGGDYSTNGLSFSAEYGKRFHQEGYWIEPQAELTYGRVSSADFTTKRGAKVHQDSMDSLVGRLGFSLGKDIKQGNVYVRASYLYDFKGETWVQMTSGVVGSDRAPVYKTDLGGGWWEFGVGTNLDLGHDTHFYLDVETTAGGDVDTPWQWNAGVRYSF